MEFNELQQIVESNSRSIQAIGDRLAELTHDIEELKDIQREAAQERAELRRATLGIANLLASLDDDRPTILGRLSRIENKVDRLLERGE
jgi:chromosome segregation ATPase